MTLTAPTPKLLWLCALVWLCVHGVAFTDFREFKVLLTSWTELALPLDKQFLYSSPWLAMLGRALAPLLGPSLSYATLCIAGLGLLGFSLHKSLLRSCGPDKVWLAWLLLMSTPLPMVLLQWVGKSDSYLLAAWLLMRLTNRQAVHLALAMVMVLCHRELALLILSLDALLARRLRPAVLVGAAVGIGMMAAYHHVILDRVPAGRVAYAAQGQWSIPLGNLTMWPAMLACSLSWAWVPFIAFCKPKWLDAALLVTCLGIAAMTLDFTRIFVLLSLPWLLQLTQRGTLAAAQAIQKDRRWVLVVALLATLPSAQLVNFKITGSRIFENIDMLNSIISHAR